MRRDPFVGVAEKYAGEEGDNLAKRRSIPSGGVVPADAHLLEVRGLQIDQAALTGESVPVSKHEEPVPEDAPVADRKSMVYSGTLVSYGTARAVVTARGMEIELGRIAFRRWLCARAAARVGAGSCRLVGGDGTIAQQIGVRAARGGGLPALAPP